MSQLGILEALRAHPLSLRVVCPGTERSEDPGLHFQITVKSYPKLDNDIRKLSEQRMCPISFVTILVDHKL